MSSYFIETSLTPTDLELGLRELNWIGVGAMSYRQYYILDPWIIKLRIKKIKKLEI